MLHPSRTQNHCQHQQEVTTDSSPLLAFGSPSHHFRFLHLNTLQIIITQRPHPHYVYAQDSSYIPAQETGNTPFIQMLEASGNKIDIDIWKIDSTLQKKLIVCYYWFCLRILAIDYRQMPESDKQSVRQKLDQMFDPNTLS